MAKDKKSFVAYCDWIETFEELSNEEAGKLVKHLFRYVNDKNPDATDKLTKMMFIPMQQTLKRDLVKYEGRANNSRENGKLGGRPPKPKKPSGLIENPDEPKKPVSDSVSVSVNDNVIKKRDISIFWDQYHLISKKPKTDLEASKKHWIKLKESEKIKAESNIKNYCNSISNKKYIAKARTYISDKLFNNEFKPVTQNEAPEGETMQERSLRLADLVRKGQM